MRVIGWFKLKNQPQKCFSIRLYNQNLVKVWSKGGSIIYDYRQCSRDITIVSKFCHKEHTENYIEFQIVFMLQKKIAIFS